MSNVKKNVKSKFVSEDINDFISENQNKRPLKRTKVESIEEDDIKKLIGDYQAVGKRRKAEDGLDAGSTRQKVLETMSRQIESRKQCNDAMLKNLSDILNQFDGDITILKENEQNLERLTNMLLKCLQQATVAHQQKLKSLWGIHNALKQECEEMNTLHRAQSEQLAEDLDNDIKNLKQKLVMETKRNGWETLRKTIFHAMQNDLVEGLITRGGMKPDDRPLWFDVCRAFPPLAEPKFAKPLPDNKPIRQIFYQEDVLRAKFHSAGHGLSMIYMLSPSGETHIKRLVKQYEKLKAEGVPESELVERAAAAGERTAAAPVAPNPHSNPHSATSQVLAEADLKNIFSENKEK